MRHQPETKVIKMQVQNVETKKPYNPKRGGHLRLETGQVGNSPRIALAVEKTLHDQLVKRAEKQKTTVSALTREALKRMMEND